MKRRWGILLAGRLVHCPSQLKALVVSQTCCCCETTRKHEWQNNNKWRREIHMATQPNLTYLVQSGKQVDLTKANSNNNVIHTNGFVSSLPPCFSMCLLIQAVSTALGPHLKQNKKNIFTIQNTATINQLSLTSNSFRRNWSKCKLLSSIYDTTLINFQFIPCFLCLQCFDAVCP